MIRQYNVGQLHEINYPEVDAFADLPDIAEHTGEIYIVKTATGVFGVNRKRAGLYISSGTDWTRLGVIQLSGGESPTVGLIPSKPEAGMCVVTNLSVHPTTRKLSVDFDNTPIE